MPLAEFEEKELEGLLNAQLTGGSGQMWTPGQVLESIVGFDAALMVVHTPIRSVEARRLRRGALTPRRRYYFWQSAEGADATTNFL